jgi:peptidoglycan/LPS O-acetylase OafA/YrhL
VKKLPALDGIRGLAILMVFAVHYSGGIQTSSLPLRTITTVCALGWSGVDLFFVLSGFLITGILFETRNDPSYYRKFYARRSLRIFPIYYVFILICLLTLPFAVWQKGHLWFLLYLGFPAALITPALLQLPVSVVHLWSLSVEEQFYFVWPWLTKTLGSRENILKMCGVMVALALALRICLIHHPAWAYALIFCRMDALAIGAGIAMLQKRIKPWPIVLATTFAFGALCLLRHTANHEDPWMFTLGFSLLGLIYGAWLLLAFNSFSKIFSARILRIFGTYSYGLYLYHVPLRPFFERLRSHLPASLIGWLGYMTVCLAANLAIAMLSFHALENPLLRLKRYFNYGVPSKVSMPAWRHVPVALDVPVAE